MPVGVGGMSNQPETYLPTRYMPNLVTVVIVSK